ncbi:DUF2332 domain-containing protein [Streptomyces sp. NPDC052036]|uniref:DUF2332 domain-containing protein n=1 Tax=unclassified Streptomyces TaxID=2593676 RepID=UPI00344454F7
MSLENIAAAMQRQADACERFGSPLYAALLPRIAQDIRADGPCAEATIARAARPTFDAIALRLLSAVHYLALTGRAPAVAAHYPSTGGSFDPAEPDACWPAFRAAVSAYPAWIRRWMTRPPQTNEVGRANLLIAGLLWATAAHPLPVRLFELGASAGLNLRADDFLSAHGETTCGPANSAVRLDPAWEGAAPEWWLRTAAEHRALTVTERRGCDLSLIDPLSPDGALTLRAYVWPDQTDRLARLDGALRVAARVPARVDRMGAAEFLASVQLKPGTVTVVWHSIMRQYVPTAEWGQVERELLRLAGQSTSEAPFVHLGFEPNRVGHDSRYQLIARRGHTATVLATAPSHGLPARDAGAPQPR